jgi:sugar transferase (PEP-CTERM/EpsH1 system associated)
MSSENTELATWNGKRQPPLVIHVVHRFAMGGLENGIVNLINYTPMERYRHAVVALTDITEFRNRIRRVEVPVVALNKREGKDFGVHVRLWRVLRQLRPAILHTRNTSAIEYQLIAALTGVSGRVHGEHGRDVYDLDGSNRKYRLLRRTLTPVVSCFTAVSQDLTQWLVQAVGVTTDKVYHVCNGVDVCRFYPRNGKRPSCVPESFAQDETMVVGTVGRMQRVKDQTTLVQAFNHLFHHHREGRKRLRLVMVGDGPLRGEAQNLLRATGVEALAWLPGERNDIPELMRGFDLFVLPSIAEGISNTILEAMASGLPVIATNVGGYPELVVEAETGTLLPPSDPVAMAEAIHSYLKDPAKLERHGQAGRKRAVEHFSIEKMVEGYLRVYDDVLAERGRGRWNFGFRNADCGMKDG